MGETIKGTDLGGYGSVGWLICHRGISPGALAGSSRAGDKSDIPSLVYRL